MEYLSQYAKPLLSLAVIILVIVLRLLLVAQLKKAAVKSRTDKRDLINSLKNILNFAFIIVLLIIWASELQNLALSIAAFVVAIVLATREYIQCLIGFLYYTTTRPFRVGDWIKLDGHIGEVTSSDWMKINLWEIDPATYSYTGKTITIPNSKLVLTTLINLNYLKRYVSHSFTLTREDLVNVYQFIDELEAKAFEYCKPFEDVAQRYNQYIEKHTHVVIQGPEPDVCVYTSDIGKTCVEITVFCPTSMAVEIQQKLTRDFFQLWYKHLQECPIDKRAKDDLA